MLKHPSRISDNKLKQSCPGLARASVNAGSPFIDVHQK